MPLDGLRGMTDDLRAAGVPGTPAIDVPPAPPAEREDRVDVLHGTQVADPYRWLEDESERTRAWTAAQVARTRAVLDALPGREAIRLRLTSLLSTGTVTVPTVKGNRYFYQRREGEQNQPVLYVREGAFGRDRALLDPNALRADGTVALDWWYPSWDGALLACGLSEGGDEQSTLHVLDVATGQLLPGRIPRTRAASVAWFRDNGGFFYTRYPSPGAVPDDELPYHRHVFAHALGADPAGDPEVFGAGRSPQDWPHVDVSEDGRFMLVTVTQGWSKSELYFCDLAAEDDPRRPRRFEAVAEGIEARFEATAFGGLVYLTTDLDAPFGRIVVVDPARLERGAWRELIPERDGVTIQGMRVVAGRIALATLRAASSRLELYGLDGRLERDDLLPGIGSLAGLGGDPRGRELFFGFTSFATPPTIYRLDLPHPRDGIPDDEAARRTSPPGSAGVPPAPVAGGAPALPGEHPTQVLHEPPSAGTVERYDGVALPAGLDPDAYLVEQVWYPSKDGERISMFLVRRRDAPLDGDRPALLTGYGGFTVAMTPSFVRSLPLWLDAGGVYALPNLRGGGEYGERWHRAGMLSQKQRVFDDAIAAAEWLIANGITRPERLAIQGGSNGGLLVGAVITQRPDLFRAAVCAVPLLDMLRYHHFRIAKLWVAEYGSADDPQQFRWLYAYSPYHRVTPGMAYPAVLLTTAEGDSRVDPMHARKMAAALQHATASDGRARPVLLRVEERAGHGAGKPLAKQIAESTDVWGFLFWQLGVELSRLAE